MKTLYSEADIARRITALGEEIAGHYQGAFTLAPILTGGFVLGADLARAVYRAGGDAKIDFLQLASYGTAQTSSGVVKLIKDFNRPVEGERILLVDDVLDSGRSLYFASKMLEDRGAADVKICVAVDKKSKRAEQVTADFVAFETDADAFLVGYGMDNAEFKRGLPDICLVE
ncbi:phosphoribosyltransferase [Parvularcula sp. IMCC14364]|uniref:phosphoribosyltransferase n=1 Tax=Parvularcula sp. IMCC14364 TaxID=3067902 RepID=UPI00274142E6|nr:phosphoribosyltransferase family protein [Parvularcula sp. IMCC14364]